MSRFLSALARPVRSLLRVPAMVMGAPGRVLGLSLPTRVAIVVGLLALVVVIVSWLIIGRLYPDQPIDKYRYWIPAIILLIAIPFATRATVKAWLQGPTSRYPEIDRAWHAGLDALREHHLDPAEIPIALVLGVKDARHAEALFAASAESFPVSGVPGGASELLWFASPRSIFLVCLGQSQVTALCNAVAVPRRDISPQQSMRDTLLGTIKAMDVGEAPDEPLAPAAAAPVSPDTNVSATIRPVDDDAGSVDAPVASWDAAATRNINAAELTAKLAHVCQLLQRLRQPACPINGILNIVPLDLALDGFADQGQVQQTLRGDLDTLRSTMQLRCPAYTLVTGMETEVGFQELVRRIGTDVAKKNRIGKGCSVWNPPSPELVEAVAANACAAFEIFAYKLFRAKDGLTKPGNPKLYALTCKVRTELRERLENILVSAYGHGDGPLNALRDEPVMFGGCYFASAGDRPDLQAFVQGVLDLFCRDQDKLEWTEKATAEDAWYQNLAHIGFALDGVLLLILIGLLVFRYLA